MEIVEALNIMGMRSLEDITKESLTTSYRKLMRKHHPDLFHNNVELQRNNEEISKTINEANETLIKVLGQISAMKQLEQMKATKEVFAVIPFKSLLDIYSGECIKLTDKDENGNTAEFELTKKNLRSHRIMVYIESSITYNGVEHQFSAIKLAVLKDEYTLECKIPVYSMDTTDIKVKAYGKEVNISISSNETKLKLKFDYGVILILDISKKIQTESGN